MECLNLNEEMRSAMRIAESMAREYGNGKISPAHLLKAMLHNEVGLSAFVRSIGKDVDYLAEWAEIRMEQYEKRVGVTLLEPDEDLIRVFEESDTVRLKMGLLEVTPICVLCALSKPQVAFSVDQLRSFPIREREILDFFQDVDTTANPIGEVQQGNTNKVLGGNSSALEKYCIDKNVLCQSGKIRPAVGREKELLQMMEILGRFSKPNVMLVGEAGVGKSALVDGLVFNMMSGRVPVFLEGVQVWELDQGALIAGATYKGELEERMKSILKELRQIGHAILYVDDIHLLLDAKQGVPSVTNILKTELSSGSLTMIGVTSEENYRKMIEPDQAFCSRFEPLFLGEPTESQAVEMLRSVVPDYQRFHQLEVEEGAILSAVRYAKRYLKDRRLPDSAVDLIDRTMTAVKVANESFSPMLAWLTEKLSSVEYVLDGKEASSLSSKLYEWESEMLARLNPIALLQLDYRTEKDCTTQERLSRLQALQKLLTEQETGIARIEPNHVAAVVASKTGIPIGKIQAEEKDRLLRMEDLLRQRVVGQDRAVKVLSDAIQESRSGMNKQGQPIGSFFFLGSTGTGKTELTKALAEALFNDEKAMIRFDMSEFKEEHSAALLYGAPPGYVGYEEGGLLVNKIRQQPYSVVLFDEIEKAHPSVFDVFLQILDEGKLHDRLGKSGDFSDSIIIFTSNLGSEWISSEIGAGRVPSTIQLMERMGQYFRPEFLARLSEIVPFSPIGDDVLMQIFDIQLQTFRKTLDSKGLRMEISEEAKRVLAYKGFTPKYGARQITGVIRNYLRRPISKMILSGELRENDLLKVELGASSDLTYVVEHPS